MIPYDELISATHAEVLHAGAHTIFEGFAHDSRAVAPGDCFVAVHGMHGDGHDFAADALERGAAAALLERGWLDAMREARPDILASLTATGATLLIVPDTRAALRQYARHILARWQPEVVAVTGATGKTTCKEALAEVLGALAPTFRSWRNYNDALGLPLSLGRLEPSHRYAVLEMGADHPGEIRQLCELTRPRIGVVTNVGATHLQYFGTVERLADELAELPGALSGDGLAVLNADDPLVRAMADRTSARTLFFGTNTHVERSVHLRIQPLAAHTGTSLMLIAEGEPENTDEALVFPHLHGDAWTTVVLATLTVADALGIPREQAIASLRTLEPLPGRMRLLAGVHGLRLLDDSHNATPESAAAGLETLAALGRKQRAPTIAVLGDMLYLGTSEQHAHKQLGVSAARQIDYLVTQGLRAERIASAARESGMDAAHVAVSHVPEDTAAAVLAFAREASATGDGTPPCVYIKGSAEIRMEQVTALLLADPRRAEEVLDRQTQAWRRIVVMRPDRPTWLEIDLSAIGHNTQFFKQLVGPDVRVLVSLKADAYGHGALRVARTVVHNGAEWLGVATVSEAEPLRRAGMEAPILVFGYIAPWQAREAVRMQLRATLYAPELARSLSQAATDLGAQMRVHVKVDTGMARLGLRAEDIEAILRFCNEVQSLPGLIFEGIFTHFSTADSADQTYALRQLDRFERVLAALDARGMRPPIVHAANSAAALTLPQARYDMVRSGIVIYGLSPSDEVQLPEGFRPALAFKTQVAQVKEIPAGEGISYGATYITTAPTHIAVLPVGYADGFRRAPANWGEVLVRGQRAPLVGRVCMDQCMIDVTHIPGVRQGDEVVLIGRQGEDELTADEIAHRLGTIPYEVTSELLARVPRIS
ncbi:MAG TPA: alanine racemase [Ktedonobacterales bacterium]|nr:alanine racemase [Ktedonobacterales bacterium]